MALLAPQPSSQSGFKPITNTPDMPGQAGIGAFGQKVPLWQQQQQSLYPQQQQLAGEMAMAGMNNQAAYQRAQLDAAQSEKNAMIGASASRYAPALQQQRFNQIFPLLSGAFGEASFQQQGGGGGLTPVGSHITQGPVWDASQIQQQVNAAQAQNAQRGATQGRSITNNLAGRGYAAGSPLEMALQGQNQASVNSANATAGREIPWMAAQGNAQQLLGSQTAAAQDVLGQQGLQVELQKNKQGYLTSLLNSLGGLV